MRTILFTAILALFGVTASAQEIMLADDDFTSTRTRAEVLAELSVAQSHGLMQQQGEITWVAPTHDTLARDSAAIRQAARHAESVNEFNTVYGPRYRN